MMTVAIPAIFGPALTRRSRPIGDRAGVLLAEECHALYARTDRVFATLMALQWISGIIMACVVAPRAWIGAANAIHPHVWASVVVGAALALPAIAVSLTSPGTRWTRYLMAVTQSLFSALLIHLSGGRIETHFHIFGSLAILAFYRDWKVILIATCVVVIDHAARGALAPQSIYGVLSPSNLRFVEHAAWVLFIDVFLLWAIRQSMQEMRRSAEHRATLEATNASIEAIVAKRTAELSESEQLNRVLIDAALDGVVATNELGEITRLNPAAGEMLKVSTDHAIGQSLDTLISLHPAEGSMIAPTVRASSRSRAENVRSEAIARRQDGSTFPAELSVSTMRTQGGLAVSTFIRDLTERKRAEAAMLERRGLQDAIEAMQQVLGVVGHELRTPLAGLRAISELLLEMNQFNGDEIRAFLTSMNTEVLKMSDVVNNLLEAARLSSGVARWQWGEYTPQDVCLEAIETIKTLLDQDKVQVNYIPCDHPIRAKGDADAMRRLILNLLSNAQKHTHTGCINVSSNVLKSSGAEIVEYRVQDSGEGMPPEIVQRLGQAFALNSGVVGAANVRGSGLGLAICKGIAAAHGGAIFVRSEPGAGTTFTVRVRADLAEPSPLTDIPIHREI